MYNVLTSRCDYNLFHTLFIAIYRISHHRADHFNETKVPRNRNSLVLVYRVQRPLISKLYFTIMQARGPGLNDQWLIFRPKEFFFTHLISPLAQKKNTDNSEVMLIKTCLLRPLALRRNLRSGVRCRRTCIYRNIDSKNNDLRNHWLTL